MIIGKMLKSCCFSMCSLFWRQFLPDKSKYFFQHKAFNLFNKHPSVWLTKLYTNIKQVVTGVLISPQPYQEGNKLQRQKSLSFIYPIYNHNWRNISTIYIYRGADKSLARPGRKQATATEESEFHISYL